MASLPNYPYGFIVNFKGKKEVDEEKAKIVRLIYEKYIEGMNRYAITVYLTEKEILRPSGDCYNWQNSMVNKILQDERYLGNEKYPQIISSEIFENARQQRERDKKKVVECRSQGCLPGRKYAFSGYIVCGHCGCFYRRSTQGKDRKTRKVSWKCAKYIELGVGKCKAGGNIYDEVLETVCIRAYNRLLGDISLIQPQHKEPLVVRQNNVLEELDVLIKETVWHLKQANPAEIFSIEETLNSLLSKRVALEWSENELDLTPFETKRIRQHFKQNDKPLIILNQTLFKNVFEKIVSLEPGKLKFILKNGAVMIEEYIPMRGQVKNAKECRSYSSKTD
jgi:site-specific DNA recombinase